MTSIEITCICLGLGIMLMICAILCAKDEKELWGKELEDKHMRRDNKKHY